VCNSRYNTMTMRAGQSILCSFETTSSKAHMYRHEAMREPDRDEFIKAMDKEMVVWLIFAQGC